MKKFFYTAASILLAMSLVSCGRVVQRVDVPDFVPPDADDPFKPIEVSTEAPTEPETSEPNIQKPEKKPDVVGIVLLSLAGLLLAAMMVILIIILKNRKYTRR